MNEAGTNPDSRPENTGDTPEISGRDFLHQIRVWCYSNDVSHNALCRLAGHSTGSLTNIAQRARVNPDLVKAFTDAMNGVPMRMLTPETDMIDLKRLHDRAKAERRPGETLHASLCRLTGRTDRGVNYGAQ